MRLEKGAKLKNRYEVIEELGQGGFGYTYKAIDHLVNRYVAIKSSDKSLSHEIRILKELNNVPHISNMYDHFTEKNVHYVVMRLVTGRSLLAYQKENGGTIPLATIKRMLPTAFITLQQMHDLGFIHRDISPGNFMITEDNTLYLIDFGTATSIKDAKYKNKQVFNHGGLASPEYNDSSIQGPWTDVYMLCATIVNLLTGEGIPLPEDRRKYDDVPALLLRRSLSAKMQNALLKGLSIDYKMRYQSVQEFANDFLLSEFAENTFGDRFEVTYHAKTEIGSKEVNQDNFMVDSLLAYACEDCELFGQIPCQKDMIHMVAIADGVSSVMHGELASKATIQAVSHLKEQQVFYDGNPQNLLEEFLNQVNEKILALCAKIGKTASTLSILIWKNNEYYVANVGDSPIYLLRKGKLSCLTEAQTVANVKIKEGKEVSIKDLHALTAYLGKASTAGSEMAHLEAGTIEKGDTFLLCTDGISVVTTELEKKKAMSKDADSAMKILFKRASKKENRDNCTAIILKF